MAQPKIELRKIRDFGANLSDTFEFIRQNFKPLLLSFFAISGVFILLRVTSYGVFESNILGALRTHGSGVTGSNIFFGENMFAHYFSWANFFYLFFGWLGFASMHVCVGAYMKYYDQHHGEKPNIEEVWNIFKKYYLKVLVLSIPVYFLTALGCLFCIAPGIFLSVVFVPFPWILIVEDASLGKGIQRCFELTKSFFWISLAIYLVTGIIYFIAAGLLVPMISNLLNISVYITTKNLNPIVQIVISVLQIFTYLFYIIFLVAAMLHYFNLVERKQATGLLQRIDQIGNEPNTDQQSEEHF